MQKRRALQSSCTIHIVFNILYISCIQDIEIKRKKARQSSSHKAKSWTLYHLYNITILLKYVTISCHPMSCPAFSCIISHFHILHFHVPYFQRPSSVSESMFRSIKKQQVMTPHGSERIFLFLSVCILYAALCVIDGWLITLSVIRSQVTKIFIIFQHVCISHYTSGVFLWRASNIAI